jgi:ComF family protein
MFAYAEQYGQEPVCTACRATPPAFSRARAAFRYDGHSRQLILPFKHGDRTDTCTILATHMVRAGHALIRDAAVLVPVPLHRRRLFERRYNQAALLARSIARVANVRVLPDGLVRDRPTQPMGDKTAAERRAELKGAFAVPPHRSRDVAGRSVLLIDDVMTSSATADACAAALKAAGAADIAVLVAARVPDPRQIQDNRSARDLI